MQHQALLKILLLEDSDFDAQLMLRELTQRGMESILTRVETRPEFEAKLDEFAPHVILLDYALPTFNGGEALAIAKERYPDIPVIMISGAVGEETAVELLKNGASDFILKNRMERLVPSIKRALNEVSIRAAKHRVEAELRALNEQLESRAAETAQELWEKNLHHQEDLVMAQELQMALLSDRFPTLPAGVHEAASAVKFSSIFKPLGAVSRDYYHVVQVSDTAVGIFICDVMGEGVRAALATTMMRVLREQLDKSSGSPGELLTQMNQWLRGTLRQLDHSLFVTACYIVVDIAQGTLTFANAGHPSPFLLREATNRVERISAQNASLGPALGLRDGVEYSTENCSVDAGDLLMTFTDGLVEVENANAEAFSMDRLGESIRRGAGLPVTKLMQDIFSDIRRFADGVEFSDDVCLVGMEISRLQPSHA